MSNKNNQQPSLFEQIDNETRDMTWQEDIGVGVPPNEEANRKIAESLSHDAPLPGIEAQDDAYTVTFDGADSAAGDEAENIATRPIVIEEVGRVSLLDRIQHLNESVDMLASVSRANGFRKGKEYSVDIQERYSPVLPKIASRVENKQQKDTKVAFQEFSKAFGTEELIQSGLASREEAIEMTKQAFSVFRMHFGTSNGSDNRRRLRAHFNYQNRLLTNKGTRKPKALFPRIS